MVRQDCEITAHNALRHRAASCVPAAGRYGAQELPARRTRPAASRSRHASSVSDSPRRPQERDAINVVALASFPHDHGWGAAVLAAQTARSARSLQSGMEPLLRDAINSMALVAAESIEEWARSHHLDITRAARNLVAEADAKDLPFYRAGLRLLEARSRDVDGLSTIVHALPTSPGGVIESMAEGRAANGKAVVAFLTWLHGPIHDWVVGMELRKHPRTTALGLIRFFLDDSIGWDRGQLRRLKRSAHVFRPLKPLSIDGVKALEPDHRYLLVRWPHLVRRLATGDPDPDAVDAALYRMVFLEAVAALREGRIDHPALDALGHSWAHQATEDLAAVFVAAARSATRVVSMTERPAFLGGLLRQLPRDAARQAEFLLSPAQRRVEMLQDWALETRRALMDDLDIPLLVELSTQDIPGIRELVLAVVAETGRDNELLQRLLTPEDDGTPIGPAEPLLVSWASTRPVPTEFATQVAGALLRQATPSPRLLRVLDDADLGQLPLQLLVRRMTDPAWADALASHDPDRWRSVGRRIVGLLRDAHWQVVRVDGSTTWAVADVLRAFPIPTLITLCETGDVLRDDVQGAVGVHGFLGAFAGSRAAEASAVLQPFLRALDSPVGGPLAEAIVGSPELLDDILQAAPAVLRPEDVLDAAFHSRDVARVVQARFSRATRLEALDSVRTKYADRPALAAAYELATAFGPAYAPYLVMLARRVRRPDPSARRGRQFDDLYHTYLLPKRTGGNRMITAPHAGLKRVQRAILREGFAYLALADAATGFRPGRSIRDHAAAHAGRAVVVSVDIDSFFPSTTYAQVMRVCGKVCDGRLSPRAVRFLTDICSYGGALPTGAPTSPAIANAVLIGVDRALAAAAERRGVAYTRYADDLTFSGDDHAVRFIPFARRLLRGQGYRLDDRKTMIFRRGRRQVVTGLVVNERPDIPRPLRRRLRAALHQREHGQRPRWHDKSMSDQELRGWLAFSSMLRPELANETQARLAALPPVADGE